MIHPHKQNVQLYPSQHPSKLLITFAAVSQSLLSSQFFSPTGCVHLLRRCAARKPCTERTRKLRYRPSEAKLFCSRSATCSLQRSRRLASSRKSWESGNQRASMAFHLRPRLAPNLPRGMCCAASHSAEPEFQRMVVSQAERGGCATPVLDDPTQQVIQAGRSPRCHLKDLRCSSI